MISYRSIFLFVVFYTMIGLIAYSVTAWALLGLFLTPSIKEETNENSKVHTKE